MEGPAQKKWRLSLSLKKKTKKCVDENDARFVAVDDGDVDFHAKGVVPINPFTHFDADRCRVM